MSYKAGIVAAITELKDRTGSSSIAIKKHMQANLPADKKWMNATFLAALKKAVADPDIDMGEQAGLGVWLGTAAVCSGGLWQPIVNALQASEKLPFEAVAGGTAIRAREKDGQWMLASDLLRTMFKGYSDATPSLAVPSSGRAGGVTSGR